MNYRDLDRRCAEILGWDTKDDIHGIYGYSPKSNGIGSPIPFYSTSLDACRELAEWAKARPLEDQMAFDELLTAKTPILPDSCSDNQRLEALLITPRQICEAFVECFGGNDDHTAENR